MNIANYYRLLGLRKGAKLKDIKASYRRLARQYHPDANPDQQAQAHFIRVTEAYKLLIDFLEGQDDLEQVIGVTTGAKIINVTEEPETQQSSQDLSKYDQQLKWKSYEKLHQLLREGKFIRAIALAEGLAQRIPQDLEIKQWQAIAYHQWAKMLVKSKQPEKAKNYFQKALNTDPKNVSLWQEIQKELGKIHK
jgi:tetratricopeptide (TPR) repeat protein